MSSATVYRYARRIHRAVAVMMMREGALWTALLLGLFDGKQQAKDLGNSPERISADPVGKG